MVKTTIITLACLQQANSARRRQRTTRLHQSLYRSSKNGCRHPRTRAVNRGTQHAQQQCPVKQEPTASPVGPTEPIFITLDSDDDDDKSDTAQQPQADDDGDVPVLATSPSGKVHKFLWINLQAMSRGEESQPYFLLCGSSWQPLQPLEDHCKDLAGVTAMLGMSPAALSGNAWKSVLMLDAAHGDHRAGTYISEVSSALSCSCFTIRGSLVFYALSRNTKKGRGFAQTPGPSEQAVCIADMILRCTQCHIPRH